MKQPSALIPPDGFGNPLREVFAFADPVSAVVHLACRAHPSLPVCQVPFLHCLLTRVTFQGHTKVFICQQGRLTCFSLS